jgi:hypothetical protein
MMHGQKNIKLFRKKYWRRRIFLRYKFSQKLDTSIALKHEFCLNNVQKLSTYITVNIFSLHNKDKLIRAVCFENHTQ